MRGAMWITPSIRQVKKDRGCRFSPANTVDVGGKNYVSRGVVLIEYYGANWSNATYERNMNGA